MINPLDKVRIIGPRHTNYVGIVTAIERNQYSVVFNHDIHGYIRVVFSEDELELMI